jgi:transcription-repair coupling factor (superfamily II helicase)
MVDIRSLLQPILDHAAFRAACQALTSDVLAEPGGEFPRREGLLPVTLSGLTPSAKALAVAALAHELRRPVVVLTSTNEASEALRETASTFLSWLEAGAGAAVQTLLALDCSPYEGRSPHGEISEQRAVALWNLGRGRTRVLFVPVAAALGRFRKRSFYASLALELKLGDELDLADLTQHLASEA